MSYSGQYVFDLMDTYGGGLGVLWVAIFESAVIMWVYGVNRFSDDIGFMLNHKVSSKKYSQKPYKVVGKISIIPYLIE